METLLQHVREILSIQLFTIGTSVITVWVLVYLVGAILVVTYLSGVIKRVLINRVLKHRVADVGVRQAIGTIVRYVILLIGFAIIIQTAGIDLSALTIILGALGVGIGFGLQNITDNFISGIIILFERPIKVGDRVQVGAITGNVVRISPRATTVITNDNISVIIPNSQFISSNVINWSHTDRNVRIHVPVGVSYGSDVEQVRAVLLEVAGKHPGVLSAPKAEVLFRGFGDSSLDFELLVWTQSFTDRPAFLQSELNFRIRARFQEAGIEVPFPQRDLHIKSGKIGG